MPLMRSWVDSANDERTDFPLNNLALGVFCRGNDDPRCGVAIGDAILDVHALEQAGLLRLADRPLFGAPRWNALIAAGPATWARLRIMLTGFLAEGSPLRHLIAPHLVAQCAVEMYPPLQVHDVTTFAGSHVHMRACGITPDVARRHPLWQDARVADLVLSGHDISRPHAIRQDPLTERHRLGPCEMIDPAFELGTILGQDITGPLDADAADHMIFGHVLVTSWIIRDPGAGPARIATGIGTWIVMRAALDPFRQPVPQDDTLPAHLRQTRDALHDITLTATLTAEGQPETLICTTALQASAWTPAQMLAQRALTGTGLQAGDLLCSGPLSGTAPGSRATLSEAAALGPVMLAGHNPRRWLQDGDTTCMQARARGRGYTVGFGECRGQLLPARDLQFGDRPVSRGDAADP